MIEAPPLLTIATKRRRPTSEQIAAFRDVPTGNVCDALGGHGALDAAIKPLPGVPQKICGPALTAHSGAADIMALLAALTELTPGDVLINAVDGHQGCAAVGDMVSGMAKNAGADGLVTDGPARDIAGIRPLQFPVFATGLNPNSPYDSGPGSVGLPVRIGGATVASGDMVIGDEDGVVIVPFERIDKAITALEAIRKAEAGLEAQVRDGLVVPDAIRELVAGDRVKRV